MRNKQQQAWVVGVHNDIHAENALAFGTSLKLVLTTRKLVALISPQVSWNLRTQLRAEYDHAFVLENDLQIENNKKEDDVLSLLFAFTLQGFDKCVWLSAKEKLFVVRNCDHIFDLLDSTKESSNSDIIALPNNKGNAWFIKPNLDIYKTIVEYLQAAKLNGNDLKSYFKMFIENQCLNMKNAEKWNRQFEHMVLSVSETINMFIGDRDLKDVSFVFLSETKSGCVNTNVTYKHLHQRWNNLLNATLYQSEKPTYLAEYKKDPIAIVGMSCRFPKSNTLDEFWNLLISGCDGTSEPPEFRWRHNTSTNTKNLKNTNAGYLACPVDEFDSHFFGISNAEAVFMDPQQRLLHELVWEGLEDAAINPQTLRETQTGVFVGSWVTDYKDILKESGHHEFYRTYMGNSLGVAAARISFLLGLTGPSISTESGCSSSMVGVHMACKSLLSGESNLALAAGLNLLLHPLDNRHIPMALSPEGRCKTFSANADGFGRADGCGVLVLKRLSDALKDGDRIWALLRGSAMTQEGISKSMGTPTVYCEALAMTQALQDADVMPEQVSYVECHGTGTIVGDPLETAAICKAYGSKARQEPLIIGSVKTNIGHTEATSGIAGLIKVVLSMQNEKIPPHINFTELNPAIDLDAIPAKLPLEPVEWKKDKEQSRFAGVNSFGISGTDVHVVVEETPTELLQLVKQSRNFIGTSEEDRPAHLIKFSAKSEEALDKMLQNYQNFMQDSNSDSVSLGNIAYTANVGRADFAHRAAIICTSEQDFIKKVETCSIIQGKCVVSQENSRKICFLFTGQGSQYPDMGKSFYETSPVFKFYFDQCANCLESEYKINIKEAMWGSKKHEIGRTIYSQTSIFVLEYALYQLWQSWGIRPDYVLGHSLGEFCAAVCAGILHVQDALKLVAERSLLIEQLPGGKMLVIRKDHKSVKLLMQQFAKGDSQKVLDIAAVNSDEQTVVAGDSDVVQLFSKWLQDENVKSVMLDSSHAFHSKHMDGILEQYKQLGNCVNYCYEEKGCKFISGLKGKLVHESTVSSDYWVDHAREKVNFLDASKAAIELGCTFFIEIGPQPVLSSLTAQNNTSSNTLTCLPSLRKNGDEWITILQSLAKMYISGRNVDWYGFDLFYSRSKVRLPTYPFIRKQIWPETLVNAKATEIHPLLGSHLANATSANIFESNMSVNGNIQTWVKDHCIGDNVIFPGAGYLEMCLAAGIAATEGFNENLGKPNRPMKIENLAIEAPLCLPSSNSGNACSTLQIQTVVENIPENATALKIQISHLVSSDLSKNKWLNHAKAKFDPIPHVSIPMDFPIKCFTDEDICNVNEIYDRLNSIGLHFGPAFKSVEKFWWRKNNNDCVSQAESS